MARSWLVAAVAVSGLMFTSAGSLAQTAPAEMQPAAAADGAAAPCGNVDECLEAGNEALRTEGDRATLESLAYESFVQACRWGSGTGCNYAGDLASLGIGTAQSAQVYEQFMQIGCQLDHQLSCWEASQAAMVAGRRAEAWAFLALSARLVGNHLWEEDANNVLSPRLPDGAVVLPPVGPLPWAPEGVSVSLTCAGYWKSIAPDSPEAAGWQAAARAAFVAWPPLEGEPARTAEEADRWIGDQAVILEDVPVDDHVRLTASRCFMGRGPLFTQ